MCSSAHTVLHWLIQCFNVFREYVGNPIIVAAILGVTSLVLAFLFYRVQNFLIPKLVRYYKRHLKKQMDAFFGGPEKGLIGIKDRTALISVVAGSLFYVTARILF